MDTQEIISRLEKALSKSCLHDGKTWKNMQKYASEVKGKAHGCNDEKQIAIVSDAIFQAGSSMGMIVSSLPESFEDCYKETWVEQVILGGVELYESQRVDAHNGQLEDCHYTGQDAQDFYRVRLEVWRMMYKVASSQDGSDPAEDAKNR